LADDSITDLYCMKASQVAWTTVLLAYILYRVDQQPTPIIGMFSAVDAAREFSQEKLTPYVESCAAVVDKIDVSTTRRTGHSLLHRAFPGGSLNLTGSNAVRSV